jgi:hypothetical protein
MKAAKLWALATEDFFLNVTLTFVPRCTHLTKARTIVRGLVQPYYPSTNNTEVIGNVYISGVL